MKNYIKQMLREGLEYHHVSDATKDEYVMGENNYEDELHFLGGKFNKHGHNTIVRGEEPIADLGVSEVGEIDIEGTKIPKAIYIVDYNASKEGAGYGPLGIKFIFNKLPIIQNLILQCLDTACPFWIKIGGVEVHSKKMTSGHMLRTIVVNRDNFNKTKYAN